MAYYEILGVILFCGMSFLLGVIVGKIIGMKEMQVRDYQDGYKEGFDTAKQMFYEDPKKEREEEHQRLMQQIEEANSQPPRLTPEILMAYGVESSAHLPESVRAFYNLKNGQSAVDLDYLINEEVTENDRD